MTAPSDRGRRVAGGALLLLALLVACAEGPRAIRYGSEECAFCRMTISDERFGATFTTAQGRLHVFDSVECMASWALANDALAGARSIRVTDFARPRAMLGAEEAVFLRAADRQSPMGLGILAFASRADALATEPGARIMSWTDVLDLVRQEGIGATHAATHHHDGGAR